MSNTLEGAARCFAQRRPASFSRSATSAARTRATSTATRSCWARPSCSAASSPSTASGIARRAPRRRPLRNSGGQAEAGQLRDATVPQLGAGTSGGGPIVDLGSHQIDIYNWYTRRDPSHVMASGGLLYHDPKDARVCDTVMVIYDTTPLGPAKAYTDADDQRQPGLLRELHGRPGTLLISESEVNYAGQLYRDPNAPAWDEWIQKGYVSAPKAQEEKALSDSGAVADVRESVAPDQHTMPPSRCATYHQPHCRTSSTRCAATPQLPGRDRLRARSASSRSTRRSRRSPGCRSSPRTSKSRGAGTWKA